jgi:DNA helicase TIP49 (TBP-interacting protein)
MKKERLTVILNTNIRKRIKIKAAERDISVSEIVEEYLSSMIEKEELEEDMALIKFAEEREKTFTEKESLTHDEVWG